MNCSNCQHTYSDKANFCEKCGSIIIRANSPESRNTIIDIIHKYTNYMPDMQKNVMSCYEVFHYTKGQSYPEKPITFKNAYDIPGNHHNKLFTQLAYFTVRDNLINWKIDIYNPHIHLVIIDNIYTAKRIWDYFFSEFLLKFNNMVNDAKDYSIGFYDIQPLFNKNSENAPKSWLEMKKSIELLNLNNIFIVFVKISKTVFIDDKSDEHYYNQLFILTPEDIENMFPMLKEKKWFSSRFKEVSFPWCSFEKLLKELMPYLNYKCIEYYIDTPPYSNLLK